MPRVQLRWLALLVVVAGLLWWLGIGLDARLFALDAATGAPRWSGGLPSDTRVVGSPVVANGRVVVVTAGPEPPGAATDTRWQVTAFDARSGRGLWEYEPSLEDRRDVEAVTLALTAPYVSDDRVYLRVERSGGASLLVLDAGTGTPTWTAADLAFAHYSRHTDLVAAGGRVLVPTNDGDDLLVRALDERDGTELWQMSLGLADFSRYDIGPFLAASPETFYLGLSGAIVALDAATGQERFRLDTDVSENSGQIALADGILYRRSGLSSLEAYDPATGQQRWSYRQPFDERRGALRAFGVRDGTLAVYCACDTDREHNSGWLLGVGATTGEERWRVPLDAYIELYQDQPVVGGGMVFTGSEQEDVVARAVGDGAERWRLPRERGQFVATDGSLVYATDRAPRWRHWLVMLGIS